MHGHIAVTLCVGMHVGAGCGTWVLVPVVHHCAVCVCAHHVAITLYVSGRGHMCGCVVSPSCHISVGTWVGACEV